MGLIDRFFGPPSRDAFARKVTDALKHAGERRPIRFDGEAFLLTVGDGERKSIVGLGNYYDEYYASSRSVRVDILQRIA